MTSFPSMAKSRSSAWRALAWLALAGLAAGCGGAKGPALTPVKGKVVQGDKPLANAVLLFMPETGGPASGATTDAAGQFVLKSNDRLGAVPGKHKVSIRVAPEVPPPMGGQAAPPPPQPGIDFNTTAEVKPDGPNDLTLQVP